VVRRRKIYGRKPGPEGDLAHGAGMGYSPEETAVLAWALGKKKIKLYRQRDTPKFCQLRKWLNNQQPIMTRISAHLRTMNGYRIDRNGLKKWVHILDPKSGPRWERYKTWRRSARGTWVGPVKAEAPDVQQDEREVWLDSDNDGIRDFDEEVRFKTLPNHPDSDHDGVPDKNDIREYIFNAKNIYYKRHADMDGDGKRKELDPDNDDDNLSDGSEDKNGNGKYEPVYGETDNFQVNSGVTRPGKPVENLQDQQRGNKKRLENKK
jgi:hypothetical protein